MPIFDPVDFDLEKFENIVEQLPASVTIIDLEGNMLYYNEFAPKLLNRKPDYLGKDIKACHKRKSSNKRVIAMIDGFKEGSREPVQYIAKPYGEPIVVTDGRELHLQPATCFVTASSPLYRARLPQASARPISTCGLCWPAVSTSPLCS